jgi:hypothetical protein
MSRAVGAIMSVARMVSTAYRLAASMFSPCNHFKQHHIHGSKTRGEKGAGGPTHASVEKGREGCFLGWRGGHLGIADIAVCATMCPLLHD